MPSCHETPTAPGPEPRQLEQSFGGPLGTLLAGLGMGGYYIGLVWINMLLGLVLTPFFIIPLTWLQDAMKRKQEAKATKR
jgi:hypothetical protein